MIPPLRTTQGVNLAHEPSKVTHRDVARDAGGQLGLPVPLLREEGVRVALDKPEDQIADTAATDLSQPLVPRLYLRLFEDISTRATSPRSSPSPLRTGFDL